MQGGHARGGEPVPVDEGALVVAQHRDPAPGQAPGQVAERLVGADGLVAVRGAGPGDEDNGGEGAAPVGQRQRAGQRPGRRAHGDGPLVEGGRMHVRRRNGGALDVGEVQASDPLLLVDGHDDVGGRPGERTGDGRIRVGGDGRCADGKGVAEGANLRDEGGPGTAQCGWADPQRGIEVGVRLREVSTSQEGHDCGRLRPRCHTGLLREWRRGGKGHSRADAYDDEHAQQGRTDEGPDTRVAPILSHDISLFLFRFLPK